ncbi:mycothiol conjugate amidase Mca [Planctomonas psychrotolerans]|uniref:mycothiol conjugate amidase Mca n=1 Tax=Planctomonas psychrotolerans TaxID=2528712 RepID=UPI001D0CFA7D|nr:mycothiol conjugate amidase Mca [Planctomonas psychrotolerans]
MTLRLLAVHAHPDDESSKGAATYAYYRDRGAETMIVSCTGGEAGSILNESLESRAMAERDLPGLRRLELARAQAEIGFSHRWLGYADSGMPGEEESVDPNSFAAIPLHISSAPLIRIVRSFRPHVLLSYDENGGYPHPDHIRAHQVAMEAWRESANMEKYPDLGEPWTIAKLYYDRIFNADRVSAIYDAFLATNPPQTVLDQLAEMNTWMRDRPADATTRVPAGEYFEHRDRALRAHASQVSPDSSFFFWPNDVQRAAWPFEDYRLVESRVPAGITAGTPEDDLFAGIPDDEAGR